MKSILKLLQVPLLALIVSLTVGLTTEVTVRAASNTPGTILFEDDFDGTGYNLSSSEWTLSGAPGSWTVKQDASDASNMELNQNDGNTEAFALTGDKTWDNYIYEARIKENNNGYPGLLARYLDRNNYYYFRFAGTDSVELQKQVYGTWTELAKVNYTVEQGVWYDFKFVLQGGNLKGYINDELIVEVFDDSLTHGKIGFRTKWGDDSFDDIRVTQAENPPLAPNGFEVSSVSGNSVSLSWDDVTGLNTFSVWRATNEAGPYEIIDTTLSTSYTDQNLNSGERYFYKLSYLNGNQVMSSTTNPVEAVTKIMPQGLIAQPFLQAEDAKEVTSVKLHWNKVPVATEYVLYRSTSVDGTYTEIHRGTGTGYDDFGLDVNKTYYYKVEAIKDGIPSDKSDAVSARTFTVSDNISKYYNSKLNTAPAGKIYPTFKAGDTYYSYRYMRVPGTVQFDTIEMATSTDGENWSNYEVVMNRDSHPDLADCKFEGLTITYHEPTDKVVAWLHYENSRDYSLGMAASFSGTPGEQLTFNGAFRPNGNDSRDITYFKDPDNAKGYILSAGNTNSDMFIYELDETHTRVVRQVAKVFEGHHREAPAVIKKDGYYFIFTSTANGWYPSQGMYASATSMEGPWTELRPIGNTTTFSAQSGWIEGSADTTFVMNGSRWTHGWASGAFGTGSRKLPIAFNGGYAFYEYYDIIVTDNETGQVIPVQEGYNVSEGKTATASGALSGHDASLAIDGDYHTNWSYTDAFQWPQWWMVDLEDSYDLNNVQISWYNRNGSDGYHTYRIETSMDGENFELAYDGTYNLDYGFTSNNINKRARYVKVTLLDAELQNNPDYNWYVPQLYEVKVFGEQATPVDVSANNTVSLPNTNSSLQAPEDLPQGTKVYFKDFIVGDTSAQNIELAGDVLSFIYELPNGSKLYSGRYQLSMGYDTSKYALDQVAIYEYNEDTAQWDKLNGTIADGKITVSISARTEHIYGLFAEIREDTSSNPENNDDKTEDETDKSITPYIYIGLGLTVLVAAGAFVYIKKRNI